MNRSQKTPLNCLKWIKIDKQLLSTIARFQLNSCSYKLSDRIEIEITRNMKNLTNKQNLSNIIMTEKNHMLRDGSNGERCGDENGSLTALKIEIVKISNEMKL